jgi:hypothetical protein
LGADTIRGVAVLSPTFPPDWKLKEDAKELGDLRRKMRTAGYKAMLVSFAGLTILLLFSLLL